MFALKQPHALELNLFWFLHYYFNLHNCEIAYPIKNLQILPFLSVLFFEIIFIVFWKCKNSLYYVDKKCMEKESSHRHHSHRHHHHRHHRHHSTKESEQLSNGDIHQKKHTIHNEKSSRRDRSRSREKNANSVCFCELIVIL